MRSKRQPRPNPGKAPREKLSVRGEAGLEHSSSHSLLTPLHSLLALMERTRPRGLPSPTNHRENFRHEPVKMSDRHVLYLRDHRGPSKWR